MKEEEAGNDTKALISLSIPIILTIGFMVLIFATIKKH
jgi:hypothetical protein